VRHRGKQDRDQSSGRNLGPPFRRRSRQKPRFLPAGYGVMSAEIASGNFSQLKNSHEVSNE